jgi:putative YhdH/YhfP family quinone oxidoreductase
MAVAILAKLGYDVAAVTGKAEAADFLTAIGANSIVSRKEASDDTDRPMLTARWAGVVDTVGGEILATALKCTKPRAVVTCCGLVASPELSTTVFPFILRGISLVGIDSQDCDMDARKRAWGLLAGEWHIEHLEKTTREVSLEALGPEIDTILKGGQKGRVIVALK